jgi:hypothetical protein
MGPYQVCDSASGAGGGTIAVQRHDFAHCSNMNPWELDRYADRFRIQHRLYRRKDQESAVLILDASGDDRFVAPHPYNGMPNLPMVQLSVDFLAYDEVCHVLTKNCLITELAEKVSKYKRFVSQTNSLLAFMPFVPRKSTWYDFTGKTKLLKYFRNFTDLNSIRVTRKELITFMPSAEELAVRMGL